MGTARRFGFGSLLKRATVRFAWTKPYPVTRAGGGFNPEMATRPLAVSTGTRQDVPEIAGQVSAGKTFVRKSPARLLSSRNSCRTSQFFRKIIRAGFTDRFDWASTRNHWKQNLLLRANWLKDYKPIAQKELQPQKTPPTAAWGIGATGPEQRRGRVWAVISPSNSAVSTAICPFFPEILQIR